MHNRASLFLGLGIMALSAWAAISAWAWPTKAAMFPLVIAIPLFCLAAAEVLWVLLAAAAARSEVMDYKLSADVPQKTARRRTLLAAGWTLGFFAMIVLLGFPIAVPLFVFLYLKIQGREGWMLSVVVTLAMWGFFYGLFDQLLHLPFPNGWIQDWLGLR